MAEQVKEYREKMIEGLAEVDDHLMEKYVHGDTISVEELKAAARKGTIAMTLFPVICGASFKNKGVQHLLDAVIDYLPSPLDIPPVQGINPETKATEERKAADDAPFAALAFKIMNDQHVGQLVFLRVYSGTLSASSGVLNSTRDRKSTRLNSSHSQISYAVFCLKKKTRWMQSQLRGHAPAVVTCAHPLDGPPGSTP